MAVSHPATLKHLIRGLERSKLAGRQLLLSCSSPRPREADSIPRAGCTGAWQAEHRGQKEDSGDSGKRRQPGKVRGQRPEAEGGEDQANPGSEQETASQVRREGGRRRGDHPSVSVQLQGLGLPFPSLFPSEGAGKGRCWRRRGKDAAQRSCPPYRKRGLW